jgi:hypothetical protein
METEILFKIRIDNMRLESDIKYAVTVLQMISSLGKRAEDDPTNVDPLVIVKGINSLVNYALSNLPMYQSGNVGLSDSEVGTSPTDSSL